MSCFISLLYMIILTPYHWTSPFLDLLQSSCYASFLAHVSGHEINDVSFGTQPCQIANKIMPYIHIYVHVLSLCHLYTSPASYLKNTNENFQKIPFLVHCSHNITPKRKESRYHCCLAITTVFHRAATSFMLQQKDRVVFVAQEY
jgi:hypothetical protein